MGDEVDVDDLDALLDEAIDKVGIFDKNCFTI